MIRPFHFLLLPAAFLAFSLATCSPTTCTAQQTRRVADVGVVSWPDTAQVLRRKVTISSETIGEFAEELTRACRTPVVIDEAALENIGCNADSQIPISIDEGTVGEALGRFCMDDDFDFELNDHFIRLTTVESAEERPVRRLYRVRPLLSGSDDDGAWDHQGLIDLVEQSIEPDTWEALGGPSTTVIFRDMLAIATTDSTHLKILRLLRTLESVRETDAKTASQTPVLRIAAIDDPSSQSVFEKLDETMAIAAPQPSESTVPSESIKLKQFAESLAETAAIPVWIHASSLDEMGVSPEESVTPLGVAMPLASLLTETLRPIDLRYSIADQTIVIETFETAEQRQPCVVYPVADLITRQVSETEPFFLLEHFIEGSAWQFANRGFKLIDGIHRPAHTVEPDKLIELITSTVHPDSWEALGGMGVISHFAPANALVVTSTDPIHFEIKKLLVSLRRARPVPQESADGDWVAQQYVTVAFELNEQAGQIADAEALARRVVDPASWLKPESSITRHGKLLVVRNQIATIVRMRNLLTKLNLLRFPSPPPHRQGGMF